MPLLTTTMDCPTTSNNYPIASICQRMAKSSVEHWYRLLPPFPPSANPTTRQRGLVILQPHFAWHCSVPSPSRQVPPLIKMDEPDIMGFYLIFLAPPLISVFVMVLAFWKGEFSQVWAYEEKWNVPKQDAKQIVDSKVTDEVSVMN